MDMRDVITISPLGISKTFDFSSRTLIDSGLHFDGEYLLSWDPSKSGRIFSAGKDKVFCSSIIDGSTAPVNCPSYESDTSKPIGLSVGNETMVAGKASGKVFVVNLEDFSLKNEIPVANNLSVCKGYKSSVVCGGKDVALSVWNLEKCDTPVFVAKNVRPDTLDLQVPIWISDVSFVEGYEDKLFVTSSKYGDFCVYDIRSGQRRPVSRSAWRVSRKLGKKTIGTGHNPAMLRDLAVTRPITRCVAYTSGPGTGLRAAAGNAIGDICLLDFRVPHVSLVCGSEAESCRMAPSVGSRAAAPPERVQTFSPAVGAISGLVCGGAGCANLPHLSVFAGINDQPVVMSSSIDRFFRVYNRDSGELLAKIFAKTPISTFLIRDSAEFPMNTQAESSKSTLTGAARETPGSVSEEEFDDIWDNMQPAAQPSELPVKRPKNAKNAC